MSILDIKIIGNSILQKTLNPVTSFDENLKSIVDNMKESMVYNEGIGLAANQVGFDLRLFLIYEKLIDDSKDFLVMINPVIQASDGRSTFEEGCLSVPNVWADVVRPERIEVDYFDVNGKERKIQADGLLARVIQHENDHLNGVLFIERLPKLKQKMLYPKLRKQFHLP